MNYGSSRDMMFMESAAAIQALAPGVNAGMQVGRPVFGERMTWALGLFTNAAGGQRLWRGDQRLWACRGPADGIADLS